MFSVAEPLIHPNAAQYADYKTEVFRKTLKSTLSILLVTMISNNDLFCVTENTSAMYFYISVVCGGLFKKLNW